MASSPAPRDVTVATDTDSFRCRVCRGIHALRKCPRFIQHQRSVSGQYWFQLPGSSALRGHLTQRYTVHCGEDHHTSHVPSGGWRDTGIRRPIHQRISPVPIPAMTLTVLLKGKGLGISHTRATKRKQKLFDLRKSKQLRCNTCVFNMSDDRFVQSFWIDKDTFKNILETVKPHLKVTTLSHSMQLTSVLRYPGCYQFSIAKDHHINIGRSTFGKILHIFIPLLDRLLCQDTICLQMSSQQMRKSSEYFFSRHQLPRIVACVDGTHIKIVKPLFVCASVFFNRKGYYSMNAMVVCNYNMEIIAIDATHTGSCHDSFIWNHSSAREYLSRTINEYFVLADSGYVQESFVLTPYWSAEIGTHQHRFNLRNAAARNIIERTIGVLKSRFYCLQRCLNYQPNFCCQIVNVSCALHNICRRRNLSISDDFQLENIEHAMNDMNI
ncbi:LOW QUALITY PROTEIN: putative nuclease HARBI1 [Drosophila nasuta]|uniref:LOW QUALITY PROTEIN: putative nuclease HARBI1 n=1 Tax=Drosophila nasuta TaxID=42062 RepID=UPI00295F4417|nr:LOW QUALITY PROTEIN: putative nuclease HARBI1 [Drosophila nasuta]